MGLTEISTAHACRLLEAGPIVLVRTADRGKPNVMTLGFQMLVQHDPALIAGFIGPWDHSRTALDANGECVIAIPTVDMVKAVVDIGNCSGADVDKLN